MKKDNNDDEDDDDDEDDEEEEKRKRKNRGKCDWGDNGGCILLIHPLLRGCNSYNLYYRRPRVASQLLIYITPPVPPS
jgi:hypothetical protein